MTVTTTSGPYQWLCSMMRRRLFQLPSVVLFFSAVLLGVILALCLQYVSIETESPWPSPQLSHQTEYKRWLAGKQAKQVRQPLSSSDDHYQV